MHRPTIAVGIFRLTMTVAVVVIYLTPGGVDRVSFTGILSVTKLLYFAKDYTLTMV